MATTPLDYGRFVGRVGALAVALGIGVAIANSPGIASADEGSDSSSGSAGSSSSSSSASSSSANSSSAGASDSDGATSRSAASSTASTASATSTVGAAGDTDDKDSGESSSDDEPAEYADGEADAEDAADADAQDAAVIDDDADGGDVDGGGNGGEFEAPGESADLSGASPRDITTVTVDTSVETPTGDTSTPVPPDPPAPAAALFAMAGSAGREADAVAAQEMVSPLATPAQLEAERIATRTVHTLPVSLMKFVLRAGFLSAGNQLFGGVDADNLAALDRAVDEYAMAAAFQQLLLNPLTPRVVTQVAPPHAWFGQTVGGSRILYDNPDTIYRFMAVSGSSQYVIRGRFLDTTDAGMPADTSFSVLEGLAGTTSSILTVDEDFVMDADGRFEITVSTEPANGRPNHLQITPGSTIIAARNTLGDWTKEIPMELSIERVGGPPNSLFAQLGGFTFLGSVINTNPLLTNLVSLVPPLPYLPPLLRGTFTALILLVRGVSEQAEYMALATRDPETGKPRTANVLPQPSSNAEFLANQLQSNGFYELDDGEALVVTIDPGTAGYFIVPTYNDWTITADYWNLPTSLNDEQACANADGTYTFVISKDDPLARNWVSTGGLNQGTISIRFQDLDPDSPDQPRIVFQEVMSVAEAKQYVGAAYLISPDDRRQLLAARKAGFNKRWAPFPQV